MSIPVSLSEDAVVRPALPANLAEAHAHATSHDLVLAWRALRARQWLHFLIVPALPLHAILATTPGEAVERLLPAALVAGLALAFAYGINAIADRRGDRPGAKNPLVGREHVPSAVWTAVTACGVASIALALASPATLRASPVLISLVASAIYSVGPRIKRVPVVGTLANLFIFTPLALLVRLDGHASPHLALLLATFVVLLTQNQLVHEAGDLAEDRGAGTTSSTVTFGTRASTRAACVLGIAAAGSFVARWGLGLVPLVASAAALAGGVLIGGASAEDAARVRHVHRRLALAAGATLYGLATLAAANAPP